MIVLTFSNKVQEALAYSCGEMLKDDWYWSSTENSSLSAWSVGVTNVEFGWDGFKMYALRVRPCLSCEAI